MDISITSNRICAVMPSHQLCLDNPLPVVEKIFRKFLQQHPLIPAYKDCHFSQNPFGPIEKITCSSDSYHVKAEERKFIDIDDDPKLIITLSKDGTRNYEELYCDKNGCDVSNNNLFNYFFTCYPDDGRCVEYYSHDKNNMSLGQDGEVSLFDEYLKQSTISLGMPQSVPSPPQAQHGQTGGSPSAFGNAPSQPSSAIPRQSTPQNPRSFPSWQTGLGVVGTIFCLYKTYKELEKIDEEGHRELEASRLKGKAGQAESAESKNTASGWKASGYLIAAIAAGAFSIYSLRP